MFHNIPLLHTLTDLVGWIGLIAVLGYLTQKVEALKQVIKGDTRQESWTSIESAPKTGKPIMVKYFSWNKPDKDVIEAVVWWRDGDWWEFPGKETQIYPPIMWKDLPE